MKHSKWIMWILILVIPVLFVGSFWYLDNQMLIGEYWEGTTPEHFVTESYEFFSNVSVTFTILNDGSESAIIVSAYVNGETAALEPNGFQAGIVPKYTSANFTVTLQNQTHFNSGETYEFRFITAKGNTISNNVTYNPI